jgi:putative peptidoglycan lipid II flippase
MSTASSNRIELEIAGILEDKAPNPTIFRHSLIYGGVSFAAYGLSMVKAIVVAKWFGISPEMDAFVLATLVPNLVGALVTSTTAGALVPVLARAAKDGPLARATVFRSAFLIFFCICLLLTSIVALCSGLIARHLGPALDPYRLMLATRMLRWASILIVSTGVYAFCSAELLSRKRYAIVAAAPAIATSLSLALVVLLHGLGPDILVWSLICGTVVQAIVILVPTWTASAGGSKMAWRSPLVTRAITAQWALLGAAVIGVANVFIDQLFSVLLPAGNVSALNYASSLNSVLMQTCVMSLAWVALPELSLLVASGNLDELRARLRYCIVLAVMISAPVTASVIVFGEKAIQVVLQHGRFAQNSTHLVFLAWLGFSLGLVPAAVGMIIVRLINALDQNAILLRIGAFLLIANVLLDYAFVRFWGLFGICLSTSLVYYLSLAILFWVMRPQLGGVLNLKMLKLLSFILAAGFAPILPVFLARLVFPGSLFSVALQIVLFLTVLTLLFSMLRLVRFRRGHSRRCWRFTMRIASEHELMLFPKNLL